MKKLFLLPFLIFTFVLQAYSFEWTDEYGVTWSIGYTTNSSMSEKNLHFENLTNYGKNVIVPDTVYEMIDGILYPRIVERIYSDAFRSKEIDNVFLPPTIKKI